MRTYSNTLYARYLPSCSFKRCPIQILYFFFDSKSADCSLLHNLEETPQDVFTHCVTESASHSRIESNRTDISPDDPRPSNSRPNTYLLITKTRLPPKFSRSRHQIDIPGYEVSINTPHVIHHTRATASVRSLHTYDA